MAKVSRAIVRGVYRIRRAAAGLRESLGNYYDARYFATTVHHVGGPKKLRVEENEVVVVCLVRDGGPWLQGFLDHYGRLGVKHFVFLDNGSKDDTVATLLADPTITVLRTAAAYKKYRLHMKTYLVDRFGATGWVLVADIDELFEYPHRSRVSLSQFTSYLNTRGYNAVIAHMIDMFPSGALIGDQNRDWTSEHRWYDPRSFTRTKYKDFYSRPRFAANDIRADEDALEVFEGGTRASGFDIQGIRTKHPLVRPSKGVRFYHHHHVKHARTADITCVLLHYKYVGDFLAYFNRIASEKSFYDSSRFYRKYVEAFTLNPSLALATENSSELSDVDQLIDDNIMTVSSNYLSENSL